MRWGRQPCTSAELDCAVGRASKGAQDSIPGTNERIFLHFKTGFANVIKQKALTWDFLLDYLSGSNVIKGER